MPVEPIKNEEEWELKLFEKLENLNLQPEDYIRGKTPEGIEQKCFELCRIYMDNPHWRESAKTVEDLTVRRITGGLTNQLFYVGLKNGNGIIDSVTIKFYLSKYLKKDDNPTGERLTDLIVSLIVSERQIGPKIFGVLPNGIIQSYYEHEQFRPKQQHNEKLLRKLAHKLSIFNSLNIPIEKERFWLLDIICDYIFSGYERINLGTLAKEMELPYLINNDFLKEIKWFKIFIKQYDQCPMVFCHNDFRGSNIMVVKDTQDIVLCDFEYSSYGLRGFDIATFLLEWDREFFDYRNFSLPPDDVIETFVRLYLEGWDIIKPGYSMQPENSCKQIMEETKIGFLFVHVFFLGIILNQRETMIGSLPYDVKHQAQSIQLIFKRYLKVKKMLIEEEIIKN